MAFISFSHLTALARTLGTTLSGRGDARHPCPAPVGLRSAVGSKDAPCRRGEVPSVLGSLRVFIRNSSRIAPDASSAYLGMSVWLFSVTLDPVDFTDGFPTSIRW